jgi:formylglycine-generating enzyme required for sulfatase activity
MGDGSEMRTLTLNAFFIDQYEVTNAEYAEKVPSHRFPADADLHPVSDVTWENARRFCEESGKRLPTEEQWEKAARGADGRIYPWGDKVEKKPHPYFSGLIKRKVGSQKQDVSFYGVSDMAGSVWEWTLGESDGKKVARGGLWNLHLDYEHSKTYDRNFFAADQRFPFLGFRCARSK